MSMLPHNWKKLNSMQRSSCKKMFILKAYVYIVVLNEWVKLVGETEDKEWRSTTRFIG